MRHKSITDRVIHNLYLALNLLKLRWGLTTESEIINNLNDENCLSDPRQTGATAAAYTHYVQNLKRSKHD